MRVKNIILTAFVAFFALSFTLKGIEYKVDTQKSKLTWIGRKVTGEHTGNIKIANGKLITDGKAITGGSFEIDMTSITNTDMEDVTYQQKLVGHLKSDDFFSTEKHPKAKLAITEAKPAGNDKYNLKGKLTIKGITHPIEFPATMQSSGNTVTAKANIKVDRTKYDIKYGSGSFFDDLGDKAIDNEFEMNVDLVATK